LYLDNKGNLLHKSTATTSFAMSYIDWADKALGNVAKLSAFETIENAYQKGERSPAFVEKYLAAMRDLDKDSDAVFDEYIGTMSVDSLQTDRIIRLVQEQGLSLNARAFKMVKTLVPCRKTDSIWFLMPNSKRINVNNRTIQNTFKEAVSTKNRELMNTLSNFIKGSYGKEYRKGKFAADVQLLEYFVAIKDTNGYLGQASYFANSLMQVSTDSMKAWDVREREAVFATKAAEKRFRAPSSRYSDQLNSIAWHYYELTNKHQLLEKAMIWSEHSMAIYKNIPYTPNVENAGYLDTYAHLLYKLQRYDEAVEWQNKAIEAQKTANIKSESYEAVRDKMINRKL
jgi:hypothetical protein